MTIYEKQGGTYRKVGDYLILQQQGIKSLQVFKIC